MYAWKACGYKRKHAKLQSQIHCQTEKQSVYFATMATPQGTVKLDEHGEEILFEAILYHESVKKIYFKIALYCCFSIVGIIFPIIVCYFFYRTYTKTWSLYLTPRGIRFIKPNFLLPCKSCTDRNLIPMESIVGRVRVKSGTAAIVEVRMTLPEETRWCPCLSCAFPSCGSTSIGCQCYIEKTIQEDVYNLGSVYNIDEFVAAVNKELDKQDQLQGGATDTAM